MTITAVDNNRNTQLVQKANEFVNQVFFGTLLREFRESQQPTLLDRGLGSSAFIRQLDQELISRISQVDKPSAVTKALLRQLDKNGLGKLVKNIPQPQDTLVNYGNNQWLKPWKS